MKKIKLVALLLAPAVIVISCQKKKEMAVPQDYTCVCTWQTSSGPQTVSAKITQAYEREAKMACAAMESSLTDAKCVLE
ncbi:MAG: hypothetical protein EOO01_18025 [Chitinophagaceae bacterium]|nr:MAG: hypothetical protein EOO01_18025 [Chitinophagaceae bacterium]